jgi:DNA segregation ATPase FtsK/SpoIIIE-like protein
MLEASAEKVRLVEENERLKKDLSLLQALDDSRKKLNEELEERARRHDIVVNKMQKELDSKEATIKGLRQEIEKSVDKARKAEGLAVQLSGECAKKDKIIERLEEEARENTQLLAKANDEIVEKSSEIYKAYREALATFGAEPEPLVRSDGLGLNGLLDWMLKEFAVLENILTDISDNSAVISCENAFTLLDHEGCQELSKIAAPRYQLPESLELEACSSRI